MPRAAELIYVAGPQAGQRAPLMVNPILAGRGDECDVRISEEVVSRKAFSLTLRRDGWIFENLTTRKMEVSGTKYKPGKELILDTGDVICPGMETELLFVAADADPEVALAAYRQKQAQAAPPEPLVELLPDAPPPPPASGENVPLPAPEPLPDTSLAIGAEKAEKVTDQELRIAVQAKEKAAKRRKILIAFGVYAMAMVGVIILLKAFRQEKPVVGPVGAPPTLSKEQIDACVRMGYQDYLASQRRESLSLDPGKAEDCLLKARLLWANRTAAIGNLYQAFRNYKLHLTYSGLHMPAAPKDVDDSDAARNELIDRLWKLSQNVKLAEDSASWPKALTELEKLERTLKDCTDNDPEFPILKNARAHDTFVHGAMQKKKSKGSW